ncbi:hypothetical protein [Paraburkholderia bannensis]|uniref:hypothetical protein n=1 Tax=Paraburkholderia bannensis TaxID=765414 RepID=UPI002AB12073|nr:hypothetical protein [Paraburkholderia bannensis]
MNRYASIFVAGLTLIFSFPSVALADNGTVTLVDGTSALAVDGPASVQVRMGECQFSISLKEGEHIKYNNPDVIFYRANGRVPDRDLPFVQQAHTYSGYDWWFAKHGNRSVPWIGLMCESAANFKWSSDYTAADSTPALQDIADANAINCPADFVKGKWVPISKSLNQFTSLDVAGGKVFLSMLRISLRRVIVGPDFVFSVVVTS